MKTQSDKKRNNYNDEHKKDERDREKTEGVRQVHTRKAIEVSEIVRRGRFRDFDM